MGVWNNIPARDNVGWKGRYYEMNYMGAIFSYGVASTALVSANATATGLGATAQPIIGIFNPPTSKVNLVLLKTAITVTAQASSATSPGAFVWVYANSQPLGLNANGQTPLSRFSLSQTTDQNGQTFPKSQAYAFAMGNALQGLGLSMLATGAYQTTPALINSGQPFNSTQVVSPEPSTSTALMGGQSEEENAGDWIVSPGCFLGIMGSVSTTTVSIAPKMMWCEVPVKDGI